jgi:hypothetical protein
MELPAPPESSEVSIAVYRRPRHRTSTPIRDFWSEVRYLVGRIAMVVLLLLVAITLTVGGVALIGYLFIVLLRHYVEG